MAAPTRVTIDGIEDLRRMLQETLPKEARAVMREAVSDTTRISAQLTRQHAPYETGALRRAIEEKPPKGRGLFGYVIINPGTFLGRTPAAYVIPLEYGTGARAHPFIRTTAEQMAPRFVATVIAAGQVLERNLETVGSRNL